MALQPGIQLAQRSELFLREKAFFRKRDIQHGRGMSLRKNDAVASFPFGVRGVYISFFKVQRGQDLAD